MSGTMDTILEMLKREKMLYEDIFKDSLSLTDAICREDFGAGFQLMRRREKICSEIMKCEETLDRIICEKGGIDRHELYRTSPKVREIVDRIGEVLKGVAKTDTTLKGQLEHLWREKRMNLETLDRGKTLLDRYKPFRERYARFFDKRR
jgi:hypothetical protein